MPHTLTGTSPRKKTVEKNGVLVRRYFSKKDVHPFDEVAWKTLRMKVPGIKGHVERELEFPEFWSENASYIAGSKYFRGRIGTLEWETSVRQMISRVVSVMRKWGANSGYFKDEEEATVFESELAYILLHQFAAFNSPVWFNAGVDEHPQCSACFILSVEDNMESILDWIHTEGVIFKRGSGSGINLSRLRSVEETLSKGGHSSGPVSFMRGADSVAGMIASGGSTRRAAKMVVLDIDHPDIMKFINAKSEEEKKVRAFIEAGYNMYDLNNDAWYSIQYQNANNTVRVTDEFMRAVENDEEFSTHFIGDGSVARTYRARDLMRAVSTAAWECGDPGMQFHTTINNWHTCPVSGPITASNPCSEYMHLDDSACNLASINLLKFLQPDGTFDIASFVHTVDIVFLAQDIIIENAAYPTEKIEKNAHEYRQIGMGYANLGALLMSMGLPYDSEDARYTAGAITALMTGEAYRFSSILAKRYGAFAGYEKNKEPMLKVLSMHREALNGVRSNLATTPILEAARLAWDEANTRAKKSGVRNSQSTVLAPTGTIALMMDCATTGIEPEFALVKTKHLVGGGTMKFVNTTVSDALRRLSYPDEQVAEILAYLVDKGTIEGAPGLRDEHLAVFDCAVKPQNGVRTISWHGHVKMVVAAQPFISGAISKTFNMSNDTTVEEVEQAYMMGWRMGLKAFAVYRDGSKAAQPLVTSVRSAVSEKQKPQRRRLPATRQSETHKFSIAGHEGYLTYSMYEDGKLGEIFIKMHKQGSTLAGLLDVFATSVSIALQYGVPLETWVTKFAHGRYEPAGFTENPNIQIATSITDYIFRYLAMRFLDDEKLADLGIKGPHHELPARNPQSETAKISASGNGASGGKNIIYADSICRVCGGMLIQTGTCKTCMQCGTSNGGC